MTPRLAWVLGDPAGIGPELVAKSLGAANMRGVCRAVIVGPMWLLQRGMRVAHVDASVALCDADRIGQLPASAVPVVDAGWPEQEFPYGVLSAAGGKLTIEMLRLAVDMARAKRVDG